MIRIRILMLGNLDPLSEYLLEHLQKNHICCYITDKDKILENKTFMEKSITEFSPDIILHSANIEDVDYCEEHENEAYKINTISTLNISKAASKHSIPILYFSSSSVFDGTKNTPYVEDDSPNPINVYGKTKLNAEEIIMGLCEKHFILRTSFYYGDCNCLVKRIINNNASIFYSADYYINPTYIEDIALCVDKLISSNKYGIYHLGSNGYSTKLDFTKFILKELNKDCIVQPLPSELKALCAPRPNLGILSSDLVCKEFDINLKDWKEVVKNYLLTICK